MMLTLLALLLSPAAQDIDFIGWIVSVTKTPSGTEIVVQEQPDRILGLRILYEVDSLTVIMDLRRDKREYVGPDELQVGTRVAVRHSTALTLKPTYPARMRASKISIYWTEQQFERFAKNLPEDDPPYFRMGGAQLMDFVRKRVEPVYPAEAKASGLRAWVMLDVTVGEGGKPELVRLRDGSVGSAETSPNSETSNTLLFNRFVEAAIEAVKQWEFDPGLTTEQAPVIGSEYVPFEPDD